MIRFRVLWGKKIKINKIIFDFIYNAHKHTRFVISSDVVTVPISFFCLLVDCSVVKEKIRLLDDFCCC